MDGGVFDEELRRLSRFELVSEFVENYYSLQPRRREELERELIRRGLPVPSMPPSPPVQAPRRSPDDRISRQCFFDYLFLLYPPTGLVYAWVFAIKRLARRDFSLETRHKLIQSLISVLYMVGEVIGASLLFAGE